MTNFISQRIGFGLGRIGFKIISIFTCHSALGRGSFTIIEFFISSITFIYLGRIRAKILRAKFLVTLRKWFKSGLDLDGVNLSDITRSGTLGNNRYRIGNKSGTRISSHLLVRFLKTCQLTIHTLLSERSFNMISIFLFESFTRSAFR